MSRSISLATLVLGIGLYGQPAALGQERQVSTVVEYIAGTDIYLNVGMDAGIVVNDTLLVYDEREDVKLGQLLVVSSTRGRSLVTFASDPFPITRGRRLRITVRPRTAPAALGNEAKSVNALGARQARRPVGGPGRQTPRASGRLSLDVNVLDSTTKPGGEAASGIDRRFTTPALRLRMAIRDLPGGLTLNTNFRAASRFSSDNLIEPKQSLRIYQASLEKTFDGFPAQMHLGRFYNPFESFSGYWDGLLVHVGEEGFGAGVAVGFQPYLANEDITTDVPKYSAFVNYRKSSGNVRYLADLSGHKLQPRNGLLDRTYLGLSQRFYWNRFTMSQRLQVDRNPLTGEWLITQLDARSVIPVGRQLSLLAQYSMRRPVMISELVDLISIRRDRMTAGFTYYISNATFGVDVAANRIDGSDISYSYAAHFNVPRTPLLDFGFRAAASYWKQDEVSTVYLAPGIRRSFGSLQWELSYQRYITDRASLANVSDALELLLTFPISRRLYYTLQGRSQWGEALDSNSLYTGFWVSF